MMGMKYGGGNNWRFNKPHYRDDLIQPDEIYEKYHQTPIKEKYEKLCAKYFSMEERRVGLSKQAALKRRINKVFLAHLDFLARRDRNLLLYIFGEGGEGKSRLAKAIYHLLALALLKYHPEWACKLKTTLTSDETHEWLPQIENGDTIIQDEDPDVMGLGSKGMLMKMNTLLKELRRTQKNVIFCSPAMHIYANVFIAIEVFGLDEDDYYTRGLVWYFDRQALDIKAYAIGFLEIDVGKVQAEWDDYMANIKDPHLDSIQKRKGGVIASSNIDYWEKLAPAFAKCAKNHGWHSPYSKKALLETYINYFIKECDEDGNPIAPTTIESKRLAEITYNYVTKQDNAKKEQQQVDKDEEMSKINIIEINDLEIVKQMLDIDYPNWNTKRRDIEIYEMNKDKGMPYSEIANNLGYGSTTPISNAMKHVTHRLIHDVGTAFELYVTKALENEEKYEIVTHDGTPGKPDVWAINNSDMTALVVSCKCVTYDLNTHSVPVDEQTPEIEKAIELRNAGYTVECICRLLNRKSKHLYDKPINLENPECLTFPY